MNADFALAIVAIVALVGIVLGRPVRGKAGPGGFDIRTGDDEGGPAPKGPKKK